MPALSLVSVADNEIGQPSPAFARAPLPSATACQWRALSLFSGGGGLDLGFLAEGIAADVAYDLAWSAVSSYNANLTPVARVADLARFSPPEYREVLLAGAPCQGFSTVGKRAVEDTRNDLLMRIADVAISSWPRVVVVENVPAALSGAHVRHWSALEDRMRLAGYNVRRLGLNGEDSGVAQRRRRLFLVCWLGSDCIRFDIPASKAPTLGEALSGLGGLVDNDVQWPDPGSVDAVIATRIAPGQKLSNVRTSERAVPTWSIPEIFGVTSSSEREVLGAVSRLRRRARRRHFGDGDPVSPCAISVEVGRDAIDEIERLVDIGYLRWIGSHVELKHTYNGKYRRLDWNDLSPTVDTHFGRASLFLHPIENRGLSAREAARIQGFPDAYRLLGSRKVQFEIVGNAVPPPMGARVARYVREALLKA